MRIHEYFRFPPMRAALAAFALALGFAVWSLVGALREPVAPAAAARPSTALTLEPVARPQPVDLDAVVASDLFDPDRSAPDEPFRMPGEPAPTQGLQQSADRPTVLGTAISGGGHAFSFATAQIGTSGPRIVREGDRLGDYTVRTIERGHVVFTTSSGTRLDIAATAAPTQESRNAPTLPSMLPAFDSVYVRDFSGRRAARSRGRAAPDTVPHG